MILEDPAQPGGGVDDGSGYSYLLNTKLAAFCH